MAQTNVTQNANADVTGTNGVSMVAGTGTITLNDTVDTHGEASLNAGTDIIAASTADVTATGAGGIVAIAGGVITMNDAAADTSVFNADSGEILLQAGGDVTLGSLQTTNATADAVAVTSLTGAIVDGGDTADDIIANTAGALSMLRAVTGIGDGDSLDLNVAVVDALNAISGNIGLLETTDALIVNQARQLIAGDVDVQTTTGNLTVAEDQAGVETTTGTVLLDANGGGSILRVDAGTTSTTGDITLEADGDVAFGSAGDVLTTGGDIIVLADADGDATGAGGALTMVDGTVIRTTNGTVMMSADGTVALGLVEATNSASRPAVTITSGNGAITDANSDDINIIADTDTSQVMLRADGGIDVDTTISELDLVNDQTGAVDVNETGDLDVFQVTQNNAGTTIGVTTGGQTNILAGGNGVTTATASAVTMDVNNDSSLDMDNVVTSQGGDIDISAEGDVDMNHANADTTSNGGDIEVVADADGDLNGNGGWLWMNDLAVINADGGTILMAADEDVVLGSVQTTNAGAAAVGIASTSADIVDGGDTLVDVIANAGTVTMTAATSIGDTNTDPFGAAIAPAAADNDIETSAAILNAHVLTGTLGAFGNINIDETDTVELRDVDTYIGNIDIETTGAGNMTATDVAAGVSNIIIDNGDVTLTTFATGGGQVLVDQIEAYLDTVNVNADGAIEEDTATNPTDDDIADIAGATLNLVSTTGGIGALDAIEVDGTFQINATSGGAAADAINLHDTIDDMPIGLINAGLGDVVLLADDIEGGSDTASIIDSTPDTLDLEIISNDANLTANNNIGIGRMGQDTDLDVNVNTLTAVTTEFGNMNIDEQDSLTVDWAKAADGNISIRAGLDLALSTVAGDDTITVGVITANTSEDNTIRLRAQDSIHDESAWDGNVDIYSGGDTMLSVVDGVIGSGTSALEVVVGGELGLQALNPAERTEEFWAALTGTAGGSTTPDHVHYLGETSTPPGMIYWNGDVIGGPEHSLKDYLRSERFYVENTVLSDLDTIFWNDVFFPGSMIEYDKYWDMPYIEFISPGEGVIQGLPNGDVFMNVQEIIEEPLAYHAD